MQNLTFKGQNMAISDRFSSWYREGKTFQCNGYPIFYKDEGEGDVILCLHGFPTASWDWHPIWGDLSRRYRVIAFDMLGYGYSAKPRGHDYSIIEAVDLCEQFLGHLGITHFHILAHDIGDNLTQEILARHLENPKYDIQSICLLNGGIFPEILRPRPIQQLLLKPILGSAITLFYNRRIFGKQFSEVFGANTKPSSDDLDAFWGLIEHNGGQRVIHKLMRYLPEGVRHRDRWVGALVNNRLPLKFIMGFDDPVSGQPMVERLHQLVPEANVSCVEGIGHYPQVEAPKKVLSQYLEFLDLLP
jgi:pimeloyl-ACP methyl ester carboxylesterase